MTLHKLAAGSGYTYLTRHVAVHDATEKRQVGLAAYYEEKGESPGRWLGSGLAGLDLVEGDVVTEEQMKLLFGQGRHPLAGHPDAVVNGWGRLGRAFPTYGATSLRQVTARAFSDRNTGQGLAWNHPIPAEERARIRTQVALNAFVEHHGRAPVDQAELTGFVASASRPAQTPVAGYDLTFSPVKSVSALWALAPPDVAREIEAAHEAAVRATLALLEAEVAFTRVGKGGIRQVPVTGLVAATFDHRDSRAGDPDLHTHVVVSNKVQSLPGEGERWLTLDGRMMFKAKVMASEHYNTHLEAGLVERLGVRFVERPCPQGRRPVREIAGMDAGLLSMWSSRRHAIELRQQELASAFRAEHHRAPTAIESLALAQEANLETRPAKHEPRSEAEQREEWREQASAVYAGGGACGDVAVSKLVAAALGVQQGRTRERGGDAGPQIVAQRVLEILEASRATWQVWHVRAETLRQARAAEVPLADLERYVRDVERHVMTDLSVPVGVPPDLGEPDVLRRPDGQSAHVLHGSATYTSRTILAAEEDLLELGLRRDGRQVDGARVEAVITDQATRGFTLDRSQAAMVRNLATSGCRVQVALAPAGSGKTSALAVLARAWEASGGDVVGLAPTAVATDELGRATGVRSETLAKYLRDVGRTGSTVGPHTLVLIDEAAMAGTRELAAATAHIVGHGGSVRLVGDDQQLSAVAAGGVFRDLAEQGRAHGTTATLTELHRFAHPAEGAATLGVRDGDPAALDHYLDNGRVHAADLATSSEAAYAAWKADQDAGKTSLLLALTRDTVLELNHQARQDRLDTLKGSPGREVELADGTRVGLGDLVVTRQNERTLWSRDGAWVKNGDRWRVLDVGADGTVTVERLSARSRSHPAQVVLPAAYVAHHVQLGYASTIHGAQGATVDTTHTVLIGNETRQSLYVALSRGRESNHLYVGASAATMDGVGLDVEGPAAGPREVLTEILARDGRAESATTIERGDAARDLRDAVLRYQDALPVLAQQFLGEQRMTDLDDAFERWLPGITEQPAYPHLRGQLAVRWVDGQAPKSVIDAATWSTGKDSLVECNDPAAVVAWRIHAREPQAYGGGPLPWLPDVPAALRGTPDVDDYLDKLHQRITDLKDRVASEARRPDASWHTPWQQAVPPDVDGNLISDLAVWRAAHDVPPTDARPTGPPMEGYDPAKHQARLKWRLTAPSDASRPQGRAATSQTMGARRREEEQYRYGPGSSIDASVPR